MMGSYTRVHVYVYTRTQGRTRVSRARAELATRASTRAGGTRTRVYAPTNSRVTRSSVLTYL